MSNGEQLEYMVKIDERFTHCLRITAASSDDAIEAAYKLLMDGMTEEDQVAMDYSLEADGFTGEHDATVL